MTSQYLFQGAVPQRWPGLMALTKLSPPHSSVLDIPRLFRSVIIQVHTPIHTRALSVLSFCPRTQSDTFFAHLQSILSDALHSMHFCWLKTQQCPAMCFKNCPFNAELAHIPNVTESVHGVFSIRTCGGQTCLCPLRACLYVHDYVVAMHALEQQLPAHFDQWGQTSDLTACRADARRGAPAAHGRPLLWH